jgi:nicotinamidase-related amidase
MINIIYPYSFTFVKNDSGKFRKIFAEKIRKKGDFPKTSVFGETALDSRNRGWGIL